MEGEERIAAEMDGGDDRMDDLAQKESSLISSITSRPSLQNLTGLTQEIRTISLRSPDLGRALELPQDDAEKYYSRQANTERSRAKGRTRTFSDTRIEQSRPKPLNEEAKERPHGASRRLSNAEKAIQPRRFLIDVEDTQRLILEQEDTDGDFQITVNDLGPRVIGIGTANSNAFKKYDIRGTALISNLLQELALAKQYGRKYVILDESRLTESPLNRVSRMIKTMFWDGLTRRIDDAGLAIICADPKAQGHDSNPRIYVPHTDQVQFDHYQKYASDHPQVNLDVVRLPEIITPSYVNEIARTPGLLTLAAREEEDPFVPGQRTLRGIPFVVPGARFNELYAWDSYFMAMGLIADGRVELAKGLVDHFVYEIKHYGKILNGSRSYYLLRSQPPFLTDMALQIYHEGNQSDEDKRWLATAFSAAIKEYETVWMSEPRLDVETGLSRYRPEGIGIPPETEASHFNGVLKPFADKHGLSVKEFTVEYNATRIKEPELDDYFLHDRAVRESGHDTSYRLEKRCANLATIDLNALLYKYEVDIGATIRDVFDDHFVQEGEISARGQAVVHSSARWFAAAAQRRERIDRYLWNEHDSLYYDYDTVKKSQSLYESVTALYALWAGCASARQAARLVKFSLRKFEVAGGLVCGTEASRGPISLARPNRQWDYPFGWAPHQILAWRGLSRYGHVGTARRLCFRWLHLCTRSVVDHNGVVPEKYDVVHMTTHVDAEYGNQGTDFKLIPREGFGWCNASIQLGLQYMTSKDRRYLDSLSNPDDVFTRHGADYGRDEPREESELLGAATR